MIVIRDVERGAVRVQVLKCDCDRAGCRLCFLLVNVAPRPYWTVGAIAPEHDVDGQLEMLLAPEAVRTLLTVQALMGVTRDRLVDRRDECVRQLKEWFAAPDWLQHVDLGLIWQTRRVSFGDDFTRTVRALEAVDRAVPDLPEGPVPAPSFEALIDRQQRVDYRPRSQS